MFGINLIDDANVATSGLSAAKIAEVKASIEAAAEAWGRYIDAPNATLDINLSIKNIAGNPLATAGAIFTSSGGPWQSRVTDELGSNTDSTPGQEDANLTIDLSYLQDPNFYFFDTSFEPNPVGLPFGQFDFLSVMVHELGHALGLTVAGNFETPFAAMTEVVGGVTYFTGANARAANGGTNIEVENSHLLSEDLLDPTTTNGQRGIITPVHIGIWEDLGVSIAKATGDADTLYGFELFDDAINSGGGNDFVNGLTGDDTINGGNGNDILLGQVGDDILNGNNDNDTLVGGAGADVLNGGDGTDRAQYSDSSSGLRVDLQVASTNTGIAAGDTYTSIEDLRGSRNGNDDLRGNSIDNRIEGLGGGDMIYGRDGDDTLIGGDGHDRLFGGDGGDALFGGSGSDDASYGDSATGVTADLQNAAFNIGGYAVGDSYSQIENLLGTSETDDLRGNGFGNKLIGGAGDDFLSGRNGDDELEGQAGNDVLRGGNGADLLNGGTGTDQVSYIAAVSGVTADLQVSDNNTGIAAGDRYAFVEDLRGSRSTDTLRGDANDNKIEGFEGDDALSGRNGDDELRGGTGNDLLYGGNGNDLLVGSSGNDVFRFATLSEGGDTIQDFQINTDTIRLMASGFSSLSAGDLAAENFHVGAVALDSDDFIIYDSATGALSYDADGDGSGAAVLLATLTNTAAIDENDFLIL